MLNFNANSKGCSTFEREDWVLLYYNLSEVIGDHTLFSIKYIVFDDESQSIFNLNLMEKLEVVCAEQMLLPVIVLKLSDLR